jgi:decaprenylphospho-beta-D-ribofuranose 2-oxidase
MTGPPEGDDVRGPAGGRRTLLSGWGGSPRSAADVVRPESLDLVATLLNEVSRGSRRVLARGLGRSYGDAATSAGSVVLDLTGFDRVLGFGAESGVVTVEAGISLDALLAWSVPKGWFVPVTPGTRYVTVGGAIAADVHGKNHHREGSIGAWVRSLRLATPAGEIVAEPDGQHAEAFWATVGGMGLTGVVLEASIEMIPIETSLISVDTERAADLDECMRLMSEGDAGYRYSVAWVDCVRRGRSLGRAVLTRGEHASLAQLEVAPKAPRGVGPGDPLAYGPRQLATVPFQAPVRLPSLPAVTAFNEAWFRKAPARRVGELQALTSFFHPLDFLGEWNRLYGRHGFTQYQVVVPFEAGEVVRQIIEQLGGSGFPSLFGVLKRFGEANRAPLSFPAPGWTLALDIPLGRPGLADLLDGLDGLVAGSGGRVYFAKDARLRPDLVCTMYPRLAEWRAARDRLDPDGVFTSDLARRLHLLTEQGGTT